jgi:phosphopantetheinyl transferase (holo-ACP synthase)
MIKTLNKPNVEGFFWALKESAYKAYFRVRSEQIISPRQFEVITLENHQAKVKTPVGIMDVYVEETSQYIHAIAQESPAQIVYEVFHFEEGNFSNNVMNHIANDLGISINEVEIHKDTNNVPILKLQNKLYLLSLSHDYNWGAYTYITKPIDV